MKVYWQCTLKIFLNTLSYNIYSEIYYTAANNIKGLKVLASLKFPGILFVFPDKSGTG